MSFLGEEGWGVRGVNSRPFESGFRCHYQILGSIYLTDSGNFMSIDTGAKTFARRFKKHQKTVATEL
jgi:hypothetical protein